MAGHHAARLRLATRVLDACAVARAWPAVLSPAVGPHAVPPHAPVGQAGPHPPAGSAPAGQTRPRL
eukprot:15475330-Alexandrium_andersonii.AAC.1